MKMFKFITRNIGITPAIAFVLCASQPLIAAAAPKSGGGAPASPSSMAGMSSGSSGSSSSGGSRSLVLTVPVVNLTRDSAFRAEVNLHSASLSIESAITEESEEYPEEKILLSGDSMITNGHQIALMLSRYGNPANMSGWFWTLGAGMRKMNGTWKTNPSQLGLIRGMASLVIDDAGKVMHHYTASGTTGHGRFGYRWVSQSIPLAIGGHIGVRHFDGQFKDVEPIDSDYSPLAIDDQASLRRRYMTRLEPAIEFGLAF